MAASRNYEEVGRSLFKKTLYRINKGLSFRELSDMIYLADIPKKAGEKMETPLDVFKYLEETGQISESNVSCLDLLLKDIMREDLRKILREKMTPGETFIYFFKWRGGGCYTEMLPFCSDSY